MPRKEERALPSGCSSDELCRAWLDGTPDGKASKDIRRNGDSAAADPRDIPLRRVYRETYVRELFGVGVFLWDCVKKDILWSTWRARCDVSKPGGRLGPRPWSLGVREATRTACAPQALFGNPRGWCAWIMGEVARRAGPELGVSPRSGREDAPSATEGTVARLRPSIQYRAVAGFPIGFLCSVDARSVLRRACDFSHLPSEERCSGRGKDARRRKAEDVVSLRVPSLTREHRMRQYVGTGMCTGGTGFWCGDCGWGRAFRPAANADGKEGI